MAFSNTPGVLKEMKIYGTAVDGMISLVAPGGKTGVCISLISYTDSIRISATSDTSILNKTQLSRIVRHIEDVVN